MAHPKGKPKIEGSGRKKGTLNKITCNMRDSMYEAFDKAGGVEYLVDLAESDPKTFAGLIGKLIPSEIKSEIVDLTPLNLSNLSDKDLKSMARIQKKLEE